ncbi:hypothetical protein [Streptomyces sp. YGL11-2]|uniref:hypothetical protein n=1 Tax=Streptomyces sp. YGL11-2 TaxID=3414028 RepID=UPI003CEAF7AA
MEPRELWERHAVLAQAFCSSDDEVRRTQGLLDEAEARRSRTLAAFAVTVGSDEVVADLLGLDAREVRLARRTVGKDDARAVAKSLLEESARERRPAPPAEAPQPEPVLSAATSAAASAPSSAAATARRVMAGAASGSRTGTFAAGPPSAPPTPADSASYVPPRPAQQPYAAPTHPPAAEPSWSPALDAVLVNSRYNGVDLGALAAELGLDVSILAARAHQLASEPRLHHRPPSDRIGRHRRMTDVPPVQQPDTTSLPRQEHPPLPPYEPQTPWMPQQHTAPWTPHDPHAAWTPQPAPVPSPPTWDPSAVTVTQHDWDGILSQWEAASTPYPSTPGQPGP